MVLYGSETWTMRKEDIRRLEAFDDSKCGSGEEWRKSAGQNIKQTKKFWKKLEKREISYTQLDRDRGNGLDQY